LTEAPDFESLIAYDPVQTYLGRLVPDN